jgi:GGDEF domain-containing protein
MKRSIIAFAILAGCALAVWAEAPATLTSLGIALFPDDATTVDALLSAAGASMYVAKYGKRNIEEAITAQDSKSPPHDGK